MSSYLFTPTAFSRLEIKVLYVVSFKGWLLVSILQTLEVSRVEFKWWDAKMPPSPLFDLD
jgi:hypothetical protein